uniref:Exostosin family protein n=1 Tax=Candidatus Kentrum sp. FM TaxID=2126340 RepID=A0A450TZ91_9GAMM|nr:MAG: Exostosin family protein [Candidatus Kentron sp. FM]VFJ75907.1 MAG: Exostosin family protein [Candidatus Kentron sp. FM]VFK23122.1 MAG: Exostosin family protein [Candidatus Kentron sp. FM]
MDHFVAFLRRVKFNIVKGYDNYPYRQLRARCMKILDERKDVIGNFDVKGGFYGRSADSSEPVTNLERNLARPGFVKNMKQSDYVLCARGAGNFSIRFYETLALGRIPLYIDTNAPLPFEDRIDWDRYLVRVPVRKQNESGDILLDFHRRHRGPAFRKLQEDIRSLWCSYFEPDAFFRQMVRLVRKNQ